MSDLPIDMSHPAVREYLALIRLQVLTPLSLLINIATAVVCASIINPGIFQISSKFYLTSITPNSNMIATFVVFLYIVQIGYCILLVSARKEETKATMVKGVGIGLVISNWVMAFWAISWILQLWIISTILLGILILVLSYANVVLLIYHTPVSHRPLDTLFIHVPLRLFLLLPLNLVFWQSLFITLGMYWKQGEPDRYSAYGTEGFIVVLVANVLALIAVVLRLDITWCVGSVWINSAIWTDRPKSVPVFATTITFTVVLPLALIATFVVNHFVAKRRTGQIVLPADEEVIVTTPRGP